MKYLINNQVVLSQPPSALLRLKLAHLLISLALRAMLCIQFTGRFVLLRTLVNGLN